MKKHLKKSAALLAALVLTAALAACGSSTEDGGDGGNGNDTVSGQFAPVAGVSATYSGVSGEATLERVDGGTEASISVSGLQPDTAYMAHLHSGGCDQADPGGPHFRFDPSGSEEPPNEIHFAFTSSEAGKGSANASSDREVPVGEAGSVVLHLADESEATGSGDVAAGGYAVLVHEGVDHSKEGSGHGDGDDHAHDDDHGGDAHSHSDKIACAQLEGGTSPASTEPADDETTIVVEGGEPVGGVQELEFDAGEEVRFRVSSDVAEQVHVHGYDLLEEVQPGGTVSFAFPAEIEGIFEVELEESGVLLAELRVNP